jgi:surfactin synthase thioesterase subunit
MQSSDELTSAFQEEMKDKMMDLTGLSDTERLRREEMENTARKTVRSDFLLLGCVVSSPTAIDEVGDLFQMRLFIPV